MTARKRLLRTATLILMLGGAVSLLNDLGAAEKRALEEASGARTHRPTSRVPRHRIEIGAVPSRGAERSFEIDIEPGKVPVLSHP